MGFIESVLAPFWFLFEPNKRIYWLYLLSSMAIFIILRRQIRSQRIPFSSVSAVVDLIWLVINQLFFKLWIAPFFALQLSAILWLNSYLIILFGNGNLFSLEVTTVTLLFAFLLFVSNDFCKFIVHLCFHRIPFLWPFHAVHHSATSLTPLTLYRIHPVELIVNSLRSFMVGVVVSGAFVYLFANQISVFTVMGVNVFVFMFNLAGSNLRHSAFYLGFGRFERWFISPAQHQIHHSADVKHFDKNFGSALAIWDNLFNSLVLSDGEKVKEFGIDKLMINRQTIKQQWAGVRGK